MGLFAKPSKKLEIPQRTSHKKNSFFVALHLWSHVMMQLMWVPSYSHMRTEQLSGTNTNMCISAKLEKAVFTDGCNTFRKFLIMSRLCQNMGWAQNNPAEKTSNNFCAGPDWFYIGWNWELVPFFYFFLFHQPFSTMQFSANVDKTTH